MINDNVNAFVETFEIEGKADGPLAGLTFAAKDIYDVAGHVTGCGNPTWAETHAPASAHAAPVRTLLEAGAKLVGKTHTDELAYSLMGANAHYGTPTNSADPRRMPGGSSSGSVAAVAAGLADIGLGSDTGGSVRMPASFCGVWGLRPTHGRVAIEGTMPVAPSFDTVGWFARDLDTLTRTTAAFGLPTAAPTPPRVLLPVDLWACANEATVAAMVPLLARIEAALGPAVPVILAPEGLANWFEAFRVGQAAEVWQSHGDWVRAQSPRFGPGVADRFRIASELTPQMWEDARATRAKITRRLTQMLADGAVLVHPTGPSPAPFVNDDEATLNAFRNRALQMLCPSGLAGLPQLSMPAGIVDGGPVGFSVTAGRDREGQLFTLADIARRA
ncbi:amidase [Acuticoccus sp. M5D2P5]|uniref:amidase n=1 Tax=Acuticoccus kalidii TaxID=2910977 RepID=UPI001F36F279|nr:amidase [Acuticoccus kalidii]MCF3932731.1 amidase [Acuticoccus kalidii]